MYANYPIKPGLFRLAEALPLVVFLVYMRLAEPVSPQQWRGPYFLSATLALIATALCLWRRYALHRINLALALYFISGSAGLALGWSGLNQLYGELEATAMLVWVAGVGLVSTLISPAGFIAAAAQPQARVRRASCGVLAVAVLAALISWQFRGSDLWSAYVPFIAVFAAYGYAQQRLI